MYDGYGGYGVYVQCVLSVSCAAAGYPRFLRSGSDDAAHVYFLYCLVLAYPVLGLHVAGWEIDRLM